MTTVPLTVTARNEERTIGGCLDSLLIAKKFAEERLALRIEIMVVLDECTDRTEQIAGRRGVTCIGSRGGKVEAQRRGLRPGPFQIFCDADVLVTEETLHALCEVMLSDGRVAVAFPPKRPLTPRRHTLLAWALHIYNLRRGFSSGRTWFSGKLFAIRHWDFPSIEEVARRAARLPLSRFYNYANGMRADEVYLSRRALMEGGPAALRETAHGAVLFRAPETWLGMYRYYRRMRMELERMDALFPETRDVHRLYGSRQPDLLGAAPRAERRAWMIFQMALLACRAAYVLQRAYYTWLSPTACDPWPAVEETKVF